MRTQKSSKPLPKIRTLNGAVCAQFKRCGKENCKCTRGELHGPYFYRFQWYRGRMVKEYVRLSDLVEVRAACARYREVREDLRTAERDFKRKLATLKVNLKNLEEYNL